MKYRPISLSLLRLFWQSDIEHNAKLHWQL